MNAYSEFSLENEVFCCFFMQEKWPPTVRKFRIFVAAISDSDPVCLCLGRVGRFSKCAGVVRNSTCLLRLFPNLVCAAWQSCENSVFLLRLFPAYVCNATGVVWKFHVFVAAISGLYVCVSVYVCVCVCVCAVTQHSHVKIPCFHCGYFQLMCLCVTRQESCENSVFSLRLLSPAYMCAVWTGPGQLQGAHLNCGNFQIWNWMCCHNSAFAIFGYS